MCKETKSNMLNRSLTKCPSSVYADYQGSIYKPATVPSVESQGAQTVRRQRFRSDSSRGTIYCTNIERIRTRCCFSADHTRSLPFYCLGGEYIRLRDATGKCSGASLQDNCIAFTATIHTAGFPFKIYASVASNTLLEIGK